MRSHERFIDQIPKLKNADTLPKLSNKSALNVKGIYLLHESLLAFIR